MRLLKLKIRNYRCFGNIEQTIKIDDLTSFIGANGSGKTSALLALNCLFSDNSSDRVLKREDFHLPKDMNPSEFTSQSLHIEAVFAFEELNDPSGGESSVPVFFKHFVVDQPNGIPYLRIRLEATWERSNNVDGAIESRICYVTCPESEPISESSMQRADRKDLDRIRVLYVPAVRNPSKQLKIASGTMMHQIISNINWSTETQTSIKGKVEELNDQFLAEHGVSILDESIRTQWIEYDSDARYSKTQLRFGSTSIENLLRKSEVVFSPSITERECTIDEMSDGLRSLFYISLVDSLLDVESKVRQERESNPEQCSFNFEPPVLTIIALEEPENHIAPHLLGKLIANLNKISQKHNAQTILTSHSASIIKRIRPESLRYFRLDGNDYTTIVHSILLPDKEKSSEAYKFIKEAVKAYPELYFAKLVILGEGDSEEIILPKLWSVKYGDVDLSGISIVPLGGRFVNHFWRLLNNLKIPYVTLLDLDKEREGGGWGRIKYIIEQLLISGAEKNALLKVEEDKPMLSIEALKNMHNWDITNGDVLNLWISHLEKYHVFFSAPLDIDFLMLESFENVYKETIQKSEGPRLTISKDGTTQTVFFKDIEYAEPKSPDYLARVEHDIRCTLKACGGNGCTYTENQKRLMIWYNYFFLNRGKPTTHIQLFSLIDDESLTSNMPTVFSRMLDDVSKILSGD